MFQVEEFGLFQKEKVLICHDTSRVSPLFETDRLSIELNEGSELGNDKDAKVVVVVGLSGALWIRYVAYGRKSLQLWETEFDLVSKVLDVLDIVVVYAESLETLEHRKLGVGKGDLVVIHNESGELVVVNKKVNVPKKKKSFLKLNGNQEEPNRR